MIGYHWPDQVLPTEIPWLNTIWMLGTAGDGPMLRPQPITSPAMLQQVFGTQGTLYKGFMQAYSKYANSLNYYLVKISGTHAATTLWMIGAQGTVSTGVTVKSYGAAARYNQIKVTIEDMQTEPGGNIQWALVFYPPTDMGDPIAYYLDSFPTLGQLVQAINTDTDQGNNFVYANTTSPLSLSSQLVGVNPSEQYLTGGDDGIDLTKDELFLQLEQAYEVLEGKGIHIIVPLGAYFDDVYDPTFYGTGVYGLDSYTSGDDMLTLYDNVDNKRCTFHEQLIDFCRQQQKFGFITHGVIGMRPFKDELLENIDDFGYMYTARLLQVTAFKDRLGLKIDKGAMVSDKGWYISVFCGDLLFNEGFNDEYWDNGAVVYACMIAQSGMAGHTSNMPVPPDIITNPDGSVKTPEYRPFYESAELALLSRLGVVTCRTSPKYGLVVHNGVTPALPDSEYHDLANVKMVLYTLWFLNQFLKQYKGANIPKDWAVLHKTINDGAKEVLDQLKQIDVVLDADYTLERTTPTWWKGSLTLAGKYTVHDIVVPLEVNLNGST